MTAATDGLRAFPPSISGLRWRPMLAGFVVTVVAVPALIVGGVAAVAATYGGQALPGTRVAGVETAGLDRAAAEGALRDALPSLSAGELTLLVGDEGRTIPYAEFGRDYDIDAMLDEALAAGRGANLLESTLAFLRTALHGTSIPARTTFDQAALERLVNGAATELVRQPSEASVQLSPAGAFEVTPSVSGRRIDLQTAYAAVASALRSLNAGDARLQLTAEDLEPAITTEVAEAAAEQATVMTAGDLTLTAGEDEFAIPAARLRGWVSFAETASGGYEAQLVAERIEAEVAALTESIDRPAQDAGYVIDGALIAVSPGVEGRELEVAASVERITDALSAMRVEDRAPSVQLSIATTLPALTTEEAQAAIPQMQVISSWTTYFTPNPGDFWGENIAVPTRYLDGYVVAPGEWFEFWSAVGPVTPERGYGPGGAIINGRSVPTGALGGGICSTSTTLFNAALRAGLEIGDRTNHFYYIPRYPTGLDATVAIADGAVTTMSFRNDTAYPIIIRGYNAYGVVTFELVGVADGRVVSFTEPVTWNHRAATDVVEYTDELPPGVEERLEYPHDGFEASVTRTVTDAAGALIHQEVYYSNYGVVNGIVREGRAAEPAPGESPGPSPSPSPTP